MEKGIVTELACGTGTMTKLLADDGYDMIGIDISYEMLDVARQKYTDDNILFLNQDMRELDLYGTAAAMVCVCDGMNYITDEKELLKVFEKIKIFLDYNGVFIFDMKTRHFYNDILGSRTIAENREDHQRAYDIKLVKDCLEKAGLTCLEVYDAFTENAAKDDSERIYFVAQRPEKN